VLPARRGHRNRGAPGLGTLAGVDVAEELGKPGEAVAAREHHVGRERDPEVVHQLDHPVAHPAPQLLDLGGRLIGDLVHRDRDDDAVDRARGTALPDHA